MMTYEEFRESMESFRKTADIEAAAQKDSQQALDQLCTLYKKFDVPERAMASRVLAEWSLSSDPGKRFDALAIIKEFRVSDALPALRELAIRLESSAEPGAPYELQKVNRIVGSLDGRHD
jgi:hypothetical protein